MSTWMNRTHRRAALNGLASGLYVLVLAGCGAKDEAAKRPSIHAGGYPGSPGGPVPVASGPFCRPMSDVPPAVLGEVTEKEPPPGPISENVPDKTCMHDLECGDGFCDRGRCAAIWDFGRTYGQECEILPTIHQCGGWLCLDGRCRSCVSDEECKSQLGGGTCEPDDPKEFPGRTCGDHTPPRPPTLLPSLSVSPLSSPK
jgi:hypothetical protein